MGEGDVAGGSSSVRFWSYNSVLKRPAKRMLIRPRGEWQWEDVTWDGVGRHSKVNLMLGALCRYYYPGMVKVDGVRQATKQWSHWRLKEYVQPDEGSSAGDSSKGGSSQAQRRTCQSVVWDEFWLRYRLEDEDDREVLWIVRRHFCRAAEKVIDDAFCNARISAVCQYYKRIKGENMSREKGASQIYLIEQQYLQEYEDGVALGFMAVFVCGRRGPDPTNPEVLCTEAAREKMVCLWHRGCRLRPEYISSKEIGFVVWEFSLLKDRSRYPGRGGGSSGNTNSRAVDKHDSLYGFLSLGYHSSIGTRRELATLLPSLNVSAAGVDRVGASTPGLATTFGVDDGLSASSGVDGTAGLSATSELDGTARLLATFGVDATLGLNATFGVDASCCTTLQPMDAITSSTLWITGFQRSERPQLQMRKGMMT
ncbi:hypothetical protein U9M48_035691 [Paspalum notatum var. saurae]|uniref:Uncharacterized protein n=1 Tax=Paspalum notatum var. saurae TaxID=547442 RepID=A0AAQ3UC35_PASNO